MISSVQQQLEHSLDLLSVGSSAGWDDIEKQYRKLIQRWHPDRYSGEDRERAQNKFIEINSAFKLIREHYRKNGSIPRRLPPEQQTPLLGTKKQVPVRSAVHKYKFVIAAFVAVVIVLLFAGILWSLDSRLAENNRDRAQAEKINVDRAATRPVTIIETDTATTIKQSSAETDY